MAAPWSISITSEADAYPAVGTAAPTSGKAVEIRVEKELMVNNRTLLAALERMVQTMKAKHLPAGR